MTKKNQGLKFAALVSLITLLIVIIQPASAGCRRECVGGFCVNICDIEKPLEDIQREGGVLLENIRREGGNAFEYVKSYVQQGLVPPLIREYTAYLEFQGNQKGWKQLPIDHRVILQPHYKVSLPSIRYAENIDTVHGQAITIGDKIYFPDTIDLYDKAGLHLMMHELEHTVQYQTLGGVTPFLIKYLILDSCLSPGYEKVDKRNGRNEREVVHFDVHDCRQIEKDADAKANGLFGIDKDEDLYKSEAIIHKKIVDARGARGFRESCGIAGCHQGGTVDNRREATYSKLPSSRQNGRRFYLRNNCSAPIEFLLRYKDRASDEWITKGWWRLKANEKSFLTSDKLYIKSSNKIAYYFARTTDGSNVSWRGDKKRQYNGKTYSMKKKEVDINSQGHYSIGLKCSSLK